MSFHRQMCMDGTEPDLVCKGAVLTECKQLHVWQRALVFLSSAFTEDWADLALFVWVLDGFWLSSMVAGTFHGPKRS